MDRLERTDLGQQEFESKQPKWDESDRPSDQAWIYAVNEHVESELKRYGFTFTASDKVDAAFHYLMDLVEINALSNERAYDLFLKFQQIYGGA